MDEKQLLATLRTATGLSIKTINHVHAEDKTTADQLFPAVARLIASEEFKNWPDLVRETLAGALTSQPAKTVVEALVPAWRTERGRTRELLSYVLARNIDKNFSPKIAAEVAERVGKDNKCPFRFSILQRLSNFRDLKPQIIALCKEEVVNDDGDLTPDSIRAMRKIKDPDLFELLRQKALRNQPESPSRPLKLKSLVKSNPGDPVEELTSFTSDIEGFGETLREALVKLQLNPAEWPNGILKAIKPGISYYVDVKNVEGGDFRILVIGDDVDCIIVHIFRFYGPSPPELSHSLETGLMPRAVLHLKTSRRAPAQVQQP